MRRIRLFISSSILVSLIAASMPSAVSAQTVTAQTEKSQSAPQMIRPPSKERLTVRTEFPQGNHVMQGQTEAMRVTLHNTGFNPAENVGFHIDTPAGTTVSTRTENWKCSQTRFRKGYRCSLDGVMDGESDSVMRVYIKTTHDTPEGVDAVNIVPFSSSTKTITSDHTSFTVIDRGDAVMLPIVQHREGGKWKTWTDGSHHEAHVNENLTYRIVVANRGSVALDKGSEIVLSQAIDKKVPLRSVNIVSGRGSCTTANEKIRCELRATEDVQPGQRLATVDVTVAITKEYNELPLGNIFTTDPSSGARHRDAFHVKTTYRPDSLEIVVHNRIQPDAGGKGEIDVNLENGANGIHHGDYRITAQLPKAINYKGVSGKNWTCSLSGQKLSCDYSAAIAKKKSSSTAKISFTTDKDAVIGGDGYEVDFTSRHAVGRAHISVLPAVSVQAVAVPADVTTYSTTRRNMVLLSAEGSELHGTALRHTWVQRCTTAADSRAFSGCTDGVVTPKASIHGSSHTRTHAYLPNVSKNTTFVFEFIAQNQSSKAHRTVKVKAKASRSAASASVDEVSQDVDTVSAQSVTSFGSMPAWFNTAMTDGGMTDVVYTSTNGMISASAKLPVLLREQLKVPSDIPVNVTAQEGRPDLCAVAHVGTSDGKDAITVTTVGLKGKYFDYVIAGNGCTYQNKQYKGLSIVFQGKVLDNNLNFSGAVTLWPTFRYDARAEVESLNLGTSQNSFRLKNLIALLVVDQSMLSATLSLGGKVDVFGEDMEVFGSVSLPSNDLAAGAALEGMEVKLTMRSPRTFKTGELSIKDLSISVGVRWTPILSNRADASMATNIYISVSGTGTIDFMGATLRISQIEADFRGSKLNNIMFKFSADLKLAGMKRVHGDIAILWQAALPPEGDKKAEPAYWSVDAMVLIESENGFSVGTIENPARLTYRNACIKVTGRVIVPKILDATVSGVFVTGFPCFPTIADFAGAAMKDGVKNVLTSLPIPLSPGDWRFDASDVKINIGDFSMNGNFSIGRFATAPFGAIDANIHLTKSDKKNSIYVQGELNPLLATAKLKGTANLSVGGVTGDFTVDAVLTPLTQRISATASTKVAGTTVALSGSFGIDKSTQVPTPYAEFAASVDNFQVEGFRLGSAKFEWHESVKSAGFSAQMDISLGFIDVDGTLVVNESKAGVGIALHTTGTLKVSDKWSANLSFDMSNCNDAACTSLGSFKISASGEATLAGKNFHLGNFNFDSGGGFRLEAHYSDRDCDTSGNIAGVRWEGCFSYSMDALLTNVSPYLKFDGDASVRIRSSTRCTTCSPRRWRGWDNWGTIRGGISMQFDPFRASLRTGGIRFTFSVS
jgi:hypothetical protein